MGIQTFIFNLYGAIDNLAWIWFYEKYIKNIMNHNVRPQNVALHRGPILDSFSDIFQSHIRERKDWMNHIKDFRDTLAHRIPLYIPPYAVDSCNNEEYSNLEEQKT